MGRHPKFGIEALLQAGLRVVRRGGWEALSVASVATELDVTPMALYRLVPDATGLRRLVANAVGQGLSPSEEGSLVVSLSTWAFRANDELDALPGLAGYVIREWSELSGWLSIIEAFLAQAAREGLEGGEAVATVNAVFAYVLARAQLADSVTKERALGPVIADPSSYPHIEENLSEFRSAKTEEAFTFGLEALIAGLARAGTRSA